MRKNTKKVTKFYDEQTINGWAVSYQYEAEDGLVPTQISVNGTKDGKAFSIVKTATNSSISFGSGGDIDGILIEGVNKELDKIMADFKK